MTTKKCYFLGFITRCWWRGSSCPISTHATTCTCRLGEKGTAWQERWIPIFLMNCALCVCHVQILSIHDSFISWYSFVIDMLGCVQILFSKPNQKWSLCSTEYYLYTTNIYFKGLTGQILPMYGTLPGNSNN